MHDPIDLVHDQTGNLYAGMRERFGDGVQVPVAQPLEVEDFISR